VSSLPKLREKTPLQANIGKSLHSEEGEEMRKVTEVAILAVLVEKVREIFEPFQQHDINLRSSFRYYSADLTFILGD